MHGACRYPGAVVALTGAVIVRASAHRRSGHRVRLPAVRVVMPTTDPEVLADSCAGESSGVLVVGAISVAA